MKSGWCSGRASPLATPEESRTYVSSRRAPPPPALPFQRRGAHPYSALNPGPTTWGPRPASSSVRRRQDLLQELAARLSAPVVATMGGGFADHIESFGGYVGSSGHKGANSALREADVVLALGVSNRGAAFDLFGAGRQVIDVNIDIEVLSHRRASLAVHATCEDFLTDLLHRVQTDRGSHHPLAATHATWWESAATRSTLRGALRPSYVVRELSKASEEHEDVGFAGDVGINTLWLMRYHRGHGQTLWTRNFATMGFALPAAVERARETGKPSIAITGDGGMAMAMAGLRPAPAADVPVLCAVLDNSGLAAIRYEQEILGWPEFESGFSNPDFGAVGRSHGWRGTTVRTAGDLHAAVEAFFSQPTPTVLNIVCSKDEPPMPAMSPRPTQVAAASVAWVRQGRKGLRSAGHALKGLTER